MSPTHDPTEHEDEREDRAREVHPLTKAFRDLDLERHRAARAEPKGCVQVPVLKGKRGARSLPITYTYWLVCQPTHVQEEIIGVDRAHLLREAWKRVQSIAGGYGS